MNQKCATPDRSCLQMLYSLLWMMEIDLDPNHPGNYLIVCHYGDADGPQCPMEIRLA